MTGDTFIGQRLGCDSLSEREHFANCSGPQGTEAALSAPDSPLNPSETNHG